MPQTTPADRDDNAASFSFPAVSRKKVTAAFDGGRITSDGGVLLLAQAERAMGICAQLAACIADPRDPLRVVHALPDILRARVLAIVRRQNIWRNLRRKLAECRPRLGVDIKRRAYGAASADVRWSVV